MRFKVWYAVLFVVLTIATVSYAGDFSADMVTTSYGGTFTAKLYAGQDKSRTEVEGTVTIARMDKEVVWVLIPSQKMYMEQPLDMRTAASMREKLEGEIERKSMGRETVNGRATTKYLVTFESQGARQSVYQWIDESERIPVKTAAVDGSWSSEFRNIRTGRQDPYLFEIPAGYTKMSLGMPDMSKLMKIR